MEQVNRTRKRGWNTEILDEGHQKKKVDPLHMATMKKEKKDWVQAIEWYEKALTENQTNQCIGQRDVGWIYLSIATCYGRLRNHTSQIAALKEGIQKTSSKSASASLKYELGSLVKDVRLLKSALEEGKGASAAMAIAVMLHFDHKSPEEAIPYYRLANDHRTANKLEKIVMTNPKQQEKMIDD